MSVSAVRPRLRGVSHRIAFYVAIVAGVVLVASAHGERAKVTCAIYAVSLAGMFGASATLHRRDWPPRAFGWLRRADHAMIFAHIGGAYTPLALLGVGGEDGTKLLVLAWLGASLGILRAALWPHAPRVVTSGLFVAVGWVVVAYMPEVHAAFEPVAFQLLITGGIAYTLGAVVYLVRWPDPAPATFGYHELFHLMIIAGCGCVFAAITRLATAG